MSRRARAIGSVLAAVIAAGTCLQANGFPVTVTVEPRIVEATLARMSLEQVDVSLRVALRASHAATIRSIAFADAFVGQVPVWIERVEGNWPLGSGQELVIPAPMQVRIHARDAVGSDDLGAIVRKGSVTVRASVEVAIATPWLARLLFMGSTRTLVRDVVLEMPIQTGPSYLGPLARIGADLADVAQRGAATWLATGLTRLPARNATVLRVGGAVASVTTRYDIDGAGSSTARERRAAGVWWSPGVFCTTREAIEPWRFDVGDATALQLGGARRRADGGTVHVGATRDHPALDLRLAALEPLLPSPSERKLFTLVDGQPRRLRLADRDAETNLVCLQLDAPRAASPARAGATLPPSAARADAPMDVAAFSLGKSRAIVWTSVTATSDDRLRLATPLHRASFGSPLVANDRLVGLIASPTSAWPSATVDAAVSRALPAASARATAPGMPR
jgi:hypothetical protein